MNHTEFDSAALADVVAGLRRAMRRAARVADPGHALSVAQLELLSSIAEHPGARPGEIARALHLAPNSVATLVTAVAARGLVARTKEDGGDQRAVSLVLTPAGAQVVEQWHQTNREILGRAGATLHPAWAALLEASVPALRALIEAINRESSHARGQERDVG